MSIEDTQKYVVTLLNESLDTAYTYHNLTHTQRVVEDAQTLAELAHIEETEKHLLLVAAWFHDTGYTQGVKNHEDDSVAIAKAFLKTQKYSETDIKLVCNLILATKLDATPNTLLEKIIRDADSSHVGSKNYLEISELLRKEWELKCHRTFTEIEWLDENIAFLSTKHKFHTTEAALNWDKRKSKNLSELLKLRKKLNADNKKLKQKKEELSFKKNKVELPERGIETVFRVTLKNHMQLSNIADTKANILLSVNAIIVSLVLSNLVSKLDNASNAYLIIPTVIFVIFTVISIILSILATRPNVEFS